MKSRLFSRSLRFQLAAAITLLLAILGAATVAGTWLLFGDFQRRVTEQDVSDSVERLLTAVQKNSNGIFLDTTRLDSTYNQPLSGEYFLIRGENWLWRSRSLWDMELALPDPPVTGSFTALPGPNGQQLVSLSRRFTRFGQAFTITAANDYSPLQAELERALILLSSVWILAVFAAVGLLNGWVAWLLKPLDRAREQVTAIHRGERQELAIDGPRELVPLADEINRLLGETRKALLRSRNALGNLGHALKTPLAVLVSLVEREEIKREPELHAALLEQLRQIGGRIQRELGQVHGASSGTINEAFIPARDVPPLLTALERAHQRQLAVDCRDESSGASLPFERADMLELLGNLLDNAFKWARTRVTVTICREGQDWLLEVADDGPGIATDDDRQTVLQRGQRLDETTAGQGLGLAIAADIVDAYRGSITLSAALTGGLRARVLLPSTAIP